MSIFLSRNRAARSRDRKCVATLSDAVFDEMGAPVPSDLHEPYGSLNDNQAMQDMLAKKSHPS